MKAFTDMQNEEFERLIAPFVVKIIDDDNEAKFKYVITKRIKCDTFTIDQLAENMSIAKRESFEYVDVPLNVLKLSDVRKTGVGSTGVPLGYAAPKPVKMKTPRKNARGTKVKGERKRRENCIGCITPLGTFMSFKEAGLAHGKSPQNIRSLTRYHVQAGNPGWSVIEKL